jgi:hypothetical protein
MNTKQFFRKSLPFFCSLGLWIIVFRFSIQQLISADLEKIDTGTMPQTVALSDGYHVMAYPGEIVTFTHVITNEGTLPDSFWLEAVSEHQWPVVLSQPEITNTIWLPLPLAVGEAVTLSVQVSLPTEILSGTINVIIGTTDTIVITATSSTSPTVYAVVTDTLSIDAGLIHSVFLPLITSQNPPVVALGADFVFKLPGPDILEYDVPLAQVMGVEWVRVQLPWKDIEPVPGEYHWQAFDIVVARMTELGIQPLALVYGAPDWAAEESCGPISDTVAFQNFMDSVLMRYGVQIDAWEFTNEPDQMYPHQWGPVIGCWGLYPEEYAEQLQVFHERVKAADASDLVVFGGLAYDNWIPGDIARDFFTQTLQYGAGQYFDVANLHYYPINSVEFPTMAHKIKEIREIMERNNVYGKRIWVTETGEWVNDVGIPGYEGSIEKQRNFIAKEFSRGFASGADNVFWLDVVEHPLLDTQAHRWLISSDHQPINGYTTYQTFAQQVEGLYSRGAYSKVPAGIEAYMFSKGGRSVYVLWSNTVTQTVNLPAVSTAMLTSRDGDFVTELPIEAGMATFDVGVIPVFIEIH